MLGAGVGAAVADSRSEFGDEFLNQSRFLITQVGLLGRVCIEIVELHEGESFIFEGGSRLGPTPTAGAGAKVKLPRAASDGKGAVDGMMDGEGTRGFVGGLAG